MTGNRVVAVSVFHPSVHVAVLLGCIISIRVLDPGESQENPEQQRRPRGQGGPSEQ